jgi:plasmid maintenance system antidote protein VapI
MNEDKLMPVHPGEVLLEEFLKPMNLSQNQIALALRVPARRINEIVHGKRRVTPSPLFQYVAPILAGIANGLRFRCG